MVKLADIKMKKKSQIQIKKLDKVKIYKKKLKTNIVSMKEKVDYTAKKDENETTPIEYSVNQITGKMKSITGKSFDKFNEYGKKSVGMTKENIEQVTQKIKRKMQNREIRKKAKTIKGVANENAKSMSTNIKKTIKTTKLKNEKRVIKNIPKTSQNTVKITQRNVQESTKDLKKTYQIAKVTAEKAVRNIKKGIKAMVSAVKAIITATNALIACLLAGGWIAMIVIVVICLIGLLCSSAMGIFFSNEKGVGGISMSSAVSQINRDFTIKLAEIQNLNEHDDFEIHSNRTDWKDVIAVYSVLVTNGKDQSDVIKLDEQRVEKLKSVFWEMNMISSRVENVEKDIETVDDKGNIVITRVTRKVLYIDITSKSVEEMAQIHNFNKKQRIQLAELQKEKYNSLWAKVLNGTSAGCNDIVQVALMQVGNIGGEPFWSWYGFSSRVEWCACFVSWCAEQCGYITSGIIPKFAACHSEGIAWFQTCGLWQERGYIPKSRRYNFFRLGK